MLSYMDTTLAVTVVNPKGGAPLRINKSIGEYRSIDEVLKNDKLPADEAWSLIQELLADPYKGLKDWVTSFGLSFSYDEELCQFEGISLIKNHWFSFFEKIKLSAGDPSLALKLINKLSKQDDFSSFRPSSHCFHVHKKLSGDVDINLLKALTMPLNVQAGDLVNLSHRAPLDSSSGIRALVSFYDVEIESSGSLKPIEGFVVQTTDSFDRLTLNDVFSQPMTLGLNRTYKCEEFTGSDWVEILSTDSMVEASKCYKEIIEDGFESRIINRISNQVVNQVF